MHTPSYVYKVMVIMGDDIAIVKPMISKAIG